MNEYWTNAPVHVRDREGKTKGERWEQGGTGDENLNAQEGDISLTWEGNRQ